MNLSGNMTRQVEADMSVENDANHVANVGRLVEDMELKMRNLLRELCIHPCWTCRFSDLAGMIEEVYFGKAKDVVGDLRSESSASPAAPACIYPTVRPATQVYKDSNPEAKTWLTYTHRHHASNRNKPR